VSEWLERLQATARRVQDAVATRLEREQVALIRGKVAATTIYDAEGAVVVEAGRTVDQEAADRAVAAGRLGAVVAAVARAHAQDLQEQAATLRAATPDGKECASLETAGDYAQARGLVGQVAIVDVTDIRGNVIVAAGTRLTDSHIRLARDAQLLGALRYSASLPQPPPAAESQAPGIGMASRAVDGPVERRTLPLLDPGRGTDPSD
jgi:hypothetical protein